MTYRLACGLLLLVFALAGCSGSSQTNAQPPEVYSDNDVWVGGSAHYDVTVRIEHERIADRWRCGMRIVEMQASAGLHRNAWQHVRAYDYHCDEQFDHLTFRFPRDQERAADRMERTRLEQELWFAFGSVVPVEKQAP